MSLLLWGSSWIYLPFSLFWPIWNEHIESIQWRLVEFKETGIKARPHISKRKINISFLIPKPQRHLLQKHLRGHIHKSPNIMARFSGFAKFSMGVPLSCQDFLNKNESTKMPNHFWFFPCGEKGQKIIFEFPLWTSYTKIVTYESKEDTQIFKHFLGSVSSTQLLEVTVKMSNMVM